MARIFRREGAGAPRAAESPVTVLRPVSVRTLVIAALIVLSIIAAIVILSRIFDLVLIMLIAIVFAEGIRRPVERLERLRLPLPLAIIAVYIVLIGILAVMVALLVQPLVSEAENLAQNVPQYQKGVQDFATSVEQQLHLNTNLSGQIAGSLGAAKDVLLSVGGYIVSIVVNFFVVLVLSFLWLTTSTRLKRFFVDLFPMHQQPLAADVLAEMGFRMGGYMRAVAINMVAVGVATGIACAVLGLPSPVLLGIFAGITAAIPMVGPFLAVVPPALLGFTISPLYPLLVLAVLLVIQLVDANTVVPVMMNRVVALPALAVVLALLVGAAIAGAVGALLAVPVAAALQVLVLRVAVPMVHAAQGRTDSAYAGAFQPVSPALRGRGPSSGGRRHEPRPT